jgi:quercetin dioxygenase-like cupin family protein/predicted small metal-binding protein
MKKEAKEVTMVTVEKKSFGSPTNPFEKGAIESVTLGGLTINRATLQPGWKWSTHVKPIAKTKSCQKWHVKYILSGKQMIAMDDGKEVMLEPGDFAIIPPGHDAWVVGNEPNVLLELIGAVKPFEGSKKMYTLECKSFGIACNAKVSDTTIDGVIEKAQAHSKADHPDAVAIMQLIGPEIATALIKSKIKEE